MSDDTPMSRPEDPATEHAAQAVSDTEAAMLTFEKKWWKYAGAKESAVRVQFDMSMTRYYQVLNALIDKPEALAIDPLTVGRLRRLRAQRQAQRSGHRSDAN